MNFDETFWRSGMYDYHPLIRFWW